MLIGVLSDTHVPRRARHLPPAVFELLDGVDMILHAGDIAVGRVLDELAALAPVAAVAGNVDPPELHRSLGETRLLTLGGFRIGLVHGSGEHGTTLHRARAAFDEVDCIVFGHSHQIFNAREGGVLMFNPGSPTDPRREPGPSLGFLRLEEEINGEIIRL